ncbi:MAG: EamA family transporter [Clostridiales bacterium]|nr:EamA family transporter [Clostridiales bacterium]
MQQYFWPLALVIASNAAYHVVTKSMPSHVNPLVSLIVTYITAIIACMVLFFVTGPQKGFLDSIHDLNWTSAALGVAIVGLEYGYIMAYRLGANVSSGPLISYIAVSIVLIPIGLLLFREHISFSQLIGVALCIVGLIFINK